MKIEKHESYDIIGLTGDEKANLLYILQCYIANCNHAHSEPLPIASKLSRLL